MGNVVRGFSKQEAYLGQPAQQQEVLGEQHLGRPLVEVGQDKEVVLVLGGTGSVGRGIVKALVERGHIPVVTSRVQEKLQELEREIEADAEQEGKEKPICFLIEEDVGEEKGAKRVRDLVLQRYGRIDRVIVSLSCRWPLTPFSDLGADEFRKALDCLVTSHFVVARTFLPLLVKKNGGSYTFVTGRVGEFCANPELGVSTVAASALFGLVLACKAEAKKHKGVTVNEARIGIRVVCDSRLPEEQELFGEHQATDPLDMGRAIAAIGLSNKTRNDYPPFFLYSPEEIRDVCRQFETSEVASADLRKGMGKNQKRRRKGRGVEQAPLATSSSNHSGLAKNEGSPLSVGGVAPKHSPSIGAGRKQEREAASSRGGTQSRTAQHV
jgi:NAD(P)-dependent dehydrogenase (short-subunit alcohol dehydrogenase family)